MSYDCSDVADEIGAALREQGVPMVDPNDDSGHGLAEVSLLACLCIELYPLAKQVAAAAGARSLADMGGSLVLAVDALRAKLAEIDGAAESLAAEYADEGEE